VVVGPATASRLTILTQPASTATAGVAFAPQPVIRIEDQFGNVRSSDSTVVTASRLAGSGTLQGATNVAAVNGIVTFTNLSHNVATNITIQFTSGSLAGTTSSNVTVSPAAASRLTIQTQPGMATAGAAFAQQPVIRIEDPYGNLQSGDNSTVVSVALNSGTGSLQGSTSAMAINGLATFTNVSYTVAETINLSFSGGSLAGATSSNVV